ncbi:MAG TPA: hypothetical protein VFH68_15450 [Polyangia bacterium]|jgi:hypothetical protein|nr:hypothetical protein [Polyangia bacterium]
MRTQTVVSASALWGLTLFLAQSACDPHDALKDACRDHNDCTGGRLCASVAGAAPACVSPSATDGSVDGIVLLPPVHCGEVWTPGTLTGPDDIPPLLVGKWQRCGGGEPVDLPSPFEFAADGTWYRLATQGDGSTVRLNGFGQAGTWQVDSTSQAGTAGRIMVYFNDAPGSYLSAQVSFMFSPRVMQLDPALYSLLP